MKIIAINFIFQLFSRSRSSSSSTTTSISRPTSTKPTKENIQNNLEADQNQNPSKKSRLNSDTDSSRLTEKSVEKSSNNPTINAEPIEQRWEDTAGMYTHKKFKKMASSAKIPIPSTSGTSSAEKSETEAESSISKVIPTTLSSVVSDRIPEKTREITSRNNSSASVEQLPSSTPLSFPSASLGGAPAATLKHGVMSLIENPGNQNPSVANFASLAAPPLMPQQQLVSQHQHVPIQQLISHHSSASTANSHLPSRQVVSASLSSKVCIH